MNNLGIELNEMKSQQNQPPKGRKIQEERRHALPLYLNCFYYFAQFIIASLSI